MGGEGRCGAALEMERSKDGRCNNLEAAADGAAGGAYARLLPAHYGEGGAPR